MLGKNTGWFTPDINQTGWWLSPTPLENDGVKVSWDDYSIPNVWKNNPNVPNHQPAKVANHTFHNQAPQVLFRNPNSSPHVMNTLWRRLQNLSKCGIFACQVNPFEMKVDESQIRPKHSNVVDVPALCKCVWCTSKEFGCFRQGFPPSTYNSRTRGTP